MTHSSSSKVIWLVIAGIACLAFLMVALQPKPRPGNLDIHIAGRPQMTNGVMLITLILSNGTPGRLNIIDDTAGEPFFVLDDGTGGPGSSLIGTGLSVMANMLKVNLAPGDTLTNAISLTNPPP